MYHPRQIGHGNTDGQHKEEVRVGFMLQPVLRYLVFIFRQPLQVFEISEDVQRLRKIRYPFSAWARRSA